MFHGEVQPPGVPRIYPRPTPKGRAPGLLPDLGPEEDQEAYLLPYYIRLVDELEKALLEAQPQDPWAFLQSELARWRQNNEREHEAVKMVSIVSLQTKSKL